MYTLGQTHISLSLSQVIEHHFIFEIELRLGTFVIGLVSLFLSKESNFPYHMSYFYMLGCEL